MASGFAHENGDFSLSAVAPDYTSLLAGSDFTLQGSWRMASVDNT
ncbi:hypothetical protein [Paeniglutamicibacter terrestris]|nr:hypothetical protein [Paeniglutamicibacter terrestris]